MFRTMLVHLQGLNYYTSYTRTVLIEIYKLVDKMLLTVLSFGHYSKHVGLFLM
jgi:hypothetical protein